MHLLLLPPRAVLPLPLSAQGSLLLLGHINQLRIKAASETTPLADPCGSPAAGLAPSHAGIFSASLGGEMFGCEMKREGKKFRGMDSMQLF